MKQESKLNAENLFPLPGEIEAAKRIPNGWVYRIAGKFRDDEDVPPEAIMGAWKVNSAGQITGGFIKNDRYDPTRLTKRSQPSV